MLFDRQSGGRRAIAAALGACLLVTLSAASTLAAEDSAEGSLCDAIDIEAINGLGPLQFEPSELVARPATCFLTASSDAESHSLGISIIGFGFDLVREQTPDATEVAVADRAALYGDGNLLVDLGDGGGTLILGLDTGDSDVEPMDFSVQVAEIVAPALASAPAGDGTGGESTMAQPPDIDGLDWGRSSVSSGPDLMQDEASAAIWQPLLDAVGAEPSQLFLLNVSASNDDSPRVGQYDAIRIVGVDGDTFRSALLEWLRNAGPGDDAVIEDVSLGGKDVVRLTDDDQVAGYMYFTGDTVHAVTFPEEIAAQVLAALP